MHADQPTIIGHRYEIIDKIGSGGMGAVYRARDLLSDEEIALKRMMPDAQAVAPGSSTSAHNFRVAMAQEFKTLAALRHPNIIAVRDYGFDEDSRPYFTMDLLVNAQTVLEAGRGRSLEVQVGYLAQILYALAYLHRRRIIHRDLKPENVLVVDGQVKLLDFGLSVAKQQNAPAPDENIAGTLAYMAPERLAHQTASEASDLYALGIIAYELMAGHHPFDTRNLPQLINQIVNDFPDLTRIDADYPMVRVIGELLEKDPAQRLNRATDALQAINEASHQDFPLETEATRESLLQSARLVGRDEEVSQLTQALERTIDGRGSAWIVSGESGVGKSRLLDEIRIRAMVRGALVLRGQAISEAGGVYEIWQSVLRWLSLLSRQETPTLDALMPGKTQSGFASAKATAESIQKRLLMLLTNTLEDIGQPVVMVFEDLQWAGTESLSLLEQVCVKAQNLPLIVLASYRNEEAPNLLRQLPSMNAIQLDRLSNESIEELSREMLGEVGARPQVVSLIQRETEGNVYFLVEVVRALAEEAGNLDNIGLSTLPQNVFSGGIKRIIERRISQVPLHARDLLYIAAAYGRRLDVNLLKYISPETDMDAWLLTCSEAAILDVESEQWRFTHDRLREEILKRIPEAARQAVHQQIALAIEELYNDTLEQIPALAHHWRMAGDVVREEGYAARAGDIAVQGGAYQEAVQFMQRALELAANDTDAVNQSERQLLYKRTLARAHLGLGEYEAAERLYRENLTQNELKQDEAGIALALANLGLVTVALERYQQARDFFQESLATYRRLGDDEGIIHTLNHLGDIEYELGNQTKAKSLYQESLSRSRQIGSGWGKAGTSGKHDDELSDEERTAYQQARETLLKELTLARQGSDKLKMAQTLQQLGAAEQRIGNHKEALRLLKLASESFRALGDGAGLVSTLSHLGQLMCSADQYDEAEGYFREALREAVTADDNVLALDAVLGLARALKAQAQNVQALTLLAFLLHAPDVPDDVMDTAEELVFELEEIVPQDEASPAWERGKALTLASIAANIPDSQ